MWTTVIGTGLEATMLAHQGGWDEIMFILGPIAVVVLLLWLAKRRVDQIPPLDRPADRPTDRPASGPEETGIRPADDARPSHPPP